MELTPAQIDLDAFRQKVRGCIGGYLGISEKYSLTFGLYVKGKLYYYSSGDDGLSLRYDIGSISKTVTAHLILSLADEGLIDLREQVNKYIELPEGSYPTVYELLTHTAGYGNLTPIEITLPSLLSHGYARKNIYEGCTARRVIKCLGKRQKRGKTGYGYSDFAYAILAVIAESVTGRPFSLLMEEFLYGKLGMMNTVISEDPRTRRPLAADRGRIYDFWRWNEDNPYIAGGGLVSNITDMMHYLILQLTDNRSFITGARRLCQGSISGGSNIATCIGWHTYKRSNQLWHVGGVGTFRSSVIFNKKRQIAVAVLGNAKGVASANVHYLAKMLYSEMKINKIRYPKNEENTD